MKEIEVKEVKEVNETETEVNETETEANETETEVKETEVNDEIEAREAKETETEASEVIKIETEASDLIGRNERSASNRRIVKKMRANRVVEVGVDAMEAIVEVDLMFIRDSINSVLRCLFHKEDKNWKIAEQLN